MGCTSSKSVPATDPHNANKASNPPSRRDGAAAKTNAESIPKEEEVVPHIVPPLPSTANNTMIDSSVTDNESPRSTVSEGDLHRIVRSTPQNRYQTRYCVDANHIGSLVNKLKIIRSGNQQHNRSQSAFYSSYEEASMENLFTRSAPIQTSG